MKNEELDKKLISKFNEANLVDIADLLSDSENTFLTPDRIDDMPEFDQDETWVCPTGYVSPVSADETIIHFSIFSYVNVSAIGYCFVSSSNWDKLAVPLKLLPPEVLADPLLKRWAWIYDGISGEQECKAIATSIVKRYDGTSDIKKNRQVFRVDTPKGSHEFVSTGDWRGLLAPIYLVPPENRPPYDWRKHTKVIEETDIKGELAVKRAAMKLARAYDKTIRTDRKNPDNVSFDHRKKYWMSSDRIEKMKHMMRYLKATDPNGNISQSMALGKMIDMAYAKIPPESKWKRSKPYPWEIISGKVKL